MNDDVARTRWFILNLSRLAGVALVITGLLVTQGAISWPVEVGYGLILLGIVDVFVAPQVLARRWRSPKE
jgi:hypothetical protein